MYLCMSVSMYTCMYVCAYVCMFGMSVCRYVVCMFAYSFGCLLVWLFVCLFAIRASMYARMHESRVCLRVYVDVSVHVCMLVCRHV